MMANLLIELDDSLLPKQPHLGRLSATISLISQRLGNLNFQDQTIRLA